MNTPTLEELLKLADDLQGSQKLILVAFPDHATSKSLPMQIALGLAGANIPMPPQHREPKPHLSTALSEQDYAQLKGALDGGAASLGYPLGVSDELVQQLANRHGMASKFKTTPSTPANPPAPKPKFKKPRHPNARKRR